MASPINVLDKLLAEERKKERKKNNNKNINKKRSKHNMSPKLRLGDIIILEFHTNTFPNNNNFTILSRFIVRTK